MGGPGRQAAATADLLDAALSHPPCPVGADQIEDNARCLELLRARTQQLRAPA